MTDQPDPEVERMVEETTDKLLAILCIELDSDGCVHSDGDLPCSVCLARSLAPILRALVTPLVQDRESLVKLCARNEEIREKEIADLRAQVERLTRERDEARAEKDLPR